MRNLTGPSNNSMIPWRRIGREEGKRIEECRLAAARIQFLGLTCQSLQEARSIDPIVRHRGCNSAKSDRSDLGLTQSPDFW